MDIWMLAFVTVVTFIGLLAIGVPIAFALAAIGIVGTVYVWGWSGLYMIVSAAFNNSTGFVFIAIPLFIMMANFLQNSGMGDDMFEIIYRWSGRVRGGLAIGTIVICAIFAAMAGVSAVGTVTMGLVAMPAMNKRGYDKLMVIGCIMAGGTLGVLIPPSIIMIVYGGMAEESVGKLFMGGVMPGILLTGLYIAYVAVKCWINPKAGPPLETRFTLKEKLIVLKGFALPILLVLLVLGTIYAGVCTPTEAAAVGAVGAFACMVFYKKLTWRNLMKALIDTANTTSMIMWIVVGAACFFHFIAVAGIHDKIGDFMLSLHIWRWWIIIIMQVIFFILGMFLNSAAIIMLCGPLFLPIVNALGFDSLWFGILFVINMEMGYLTPPFGLNLFIMKGIVPEDVTMIDIYRAIIPFVLLQVVCLVLVMIFPQIALWLPNLLSAKG